MFLIVTIFNIITILTGLFCLRKGGPVILYLALLIIIAAFVNENFIVLNAWKYWRINRNVFYNIFSLAEIIIWFIIYAFIFHQRFRIYILATGFIILLFSSWELYHYSFNKFHQWSQALYAACAVLLAAGYLFSTHLREYHQLSRDPAFCLCAASICFNSVFLLNLFTMMEPEYWKNEASRYIFTLLQSTGIILYYIFICIAFIIYSYKLKMARRN